VGLLTLTGSAVLAAEGWWRLPLQVVHGVVLVFLFTALHECIHRGACKLLDCGWVERVPQRQREREHVRLRPDGRGIRCARKPRGDLGREVRRSPSEHELRILRRDAQV